jgi:hypothetical protein
MEWLDKLRGISEQDRFARLVMVRLRKLGLKAAPTYDAANFTLKIDGDTAIFLHNAFAAWKNAPTSKAKEREIEVAIGFMSEDRSPKAFDQIAPLLLPSIRNRSHVENVWMTPGTNFDPGAYDGAVRVLCDDLVALLTIDRPTSMDLVTTKTIESWPITFDAAFDLALENLRARSASRFSRLKGGIFLSQYEDHYDASRILLPHLFEQLDLDGDPVVVTLSRTGILVAGSRDTNGLNALAETVEKEFPEVHRPIALLPIVWRDGRWSAFDTSAPGLEPLDRLRTKQSIWDYQEQKPLLEARLAADARDLFVASVLAMDDGGRMKTFCTWTYEAASLLPKTDAIYLKAGANKPNIARAWRDVEAVCGPFEVEPHVYPPRYLVKSGPEDAAWDALQRSEWPAWLPPPKSA